MISQRDIRLVHLAAFCNVSESTAHRWQSGHTPIPDDQKKRVADFFGVTRAFLMRWDDDQRPAPATNGAAA